MKTKKNGKVNRSMSFSFKPWHLEYLDRRLQEMGSQCANRSQYVQRLIEMDAERHLVTTTQEAWHRFDLAQAAKASAASNQPTTVPPHAEPTETDGEPAIDEVMLRRLRNSSTGQSNKTKADKH